MREIFFEKSWCRFPFDPVLAEWVDCALPAARRAASARENAHWLRCGGTWFAGVNALPNDADGVVGDGPELGGTAIDFIRNTLEIPDFTWDKAQVSVVYPNYPKPMAHESESAFQYRCTRDAAHIDGLLPAGPDRQRHLREHHGFLLGIPLVDAGTDAAPMVVWEGSHEIARKSFRDGFVDTPPDKWAELDVTGIYHDVRRKIFEACKRVEITARPGEAYLVHRLALHGIAPWSSKAKVGRDGRMIVYFRPQTGGPEEWLNTP